jgi:hypothetical protein
MKIMVEVLNILQLLQRDSNKVEPEPVGVCRIKIFRKVANMIDHRVMEVADNVLVVDNTVAGVDVG